MTDQHQPFPRPPLWRAMRFAFLDATTPAKGNAALISAMATYLETHGLINTTGCAIPRSGPHLLEVLDEEARRAEAGE